MRPVERIYAKNAIYQKFEVLLTNRNKRHRYGQFMVEGVRNINQAVGRGWRIDSFLYAGARVLSSWAAGLLRDVPTKVNYELDEGLMLELSGKQDTSELMAILGMRDNDQSDGQMGENPIIALFDRPSNKGNLGTLLRSCDALGVEKLIVTGHAVDIYEPEVIGASVGSFFSVPFVRLSDNAQIDGYIAALKQRHSSLKTIATTAHGAKPLYDIDLTGPVLFLIGNETEGLNRHYLEACDVLATIPMSEGASASSFNVACAATAMFCEAVRQRRI